MEHTEILTRYTANFVDEIAESGVTDVVISPGSRSTPLALLFTEHPSIKEWIIIDERSAAFFALGLAKQTKRAVALVCTSGTAAANYFPAIVEAHYSRVPLVIITADRPHELRDVGAPQAIEQIKLYGDYVKWFHEMAIPEATPEMLSYVRNKASRAVYMAHEGNGGPVHLNFPVREPLMPDFSLDKIWEPLGTGATKSRSNFEFDGTKRLSYLQLKELVKNLRNKEKGLIVCGPQIEDDFAEAVTSLAAEWGVPILADPLSQVRGGLHPKANIIEGYDAFLRNKDVRDMLKADFIIRFGAMPVSKAYLFYLKENKQALQFVVENNTGYREPTGNPTEYLFANPIELCDDLLAEAGDLKFDKEWLETWQDMNRVAKRHLTSGTEEEITEGEAVRALLETTPDESTVYAANSMPIRDVDSFMMTTEKHIEVLANRGANGIDGLLSSGMGAASTGKPVTIVAGDLSFYHDMNGLLSAKHYNLNVTILLINNNGGGIFSFLPQANNNKHFEALFGTPLDIDFRNSVFMYGGKYAWAKTMDDLTSLLETSYTSEGLHVIEVRTDRTENAEWHRSIWQAIEEEILERWS
ncbi:2-succinyl-5-enolpyruvyl-6-hydroxy-3-cyclohexene-1-carboxylic-acid synthase [Oceanobacillus piezotolerans]|uniref:2-succinyl-5-enolpyruvyl-6-hydroxy-3-cyclohexene-1-carboxylate synthase n=1 Tax=Oceanobacillus piezotolerans TaxID=2448030 RepID=A0A498D7X9_9BACI|nr:2-succinyl-5-enolpyruvyl-6-hydroxy-3-cyclohexene-1-carboxylic-acid synthase [Oceanobacillus piezotolerans]RLL46473.1 2-succinyl-5-enolpyruvyl-6-hydroxy-3-cyclohexene-1-carboxylic-acid synthase [Oceanobacillus piezotolerans]